MKGERLKGKTKKYMGKNGYKGLHKTKARVERS